MHAEPTGSRRTSRHTAEEAGHDTMKIRLGLISWATGALVLVAVTACSDDGTEPPSATPSPSAKSDGTSAASSPSPTSPSDIASADATRTMRAYIKVVDRLRQNPESDPKPLESVATSTQLKAVQVLLRRRDAEGQRQIGDTSVREMTVQSVNLDDSDPSMGKVPTVVVDVCWDVSEVDVLDESGASIVLPDRPERGWTRYTVSNYAFGTNPHDGWRVATGADLKEKPCASS